MNDCIFCKIVSGQIPCHKIWEDQNFLAFLDIKPNTKGMTLVIPKKHYDSYIFEAPKEEIDSIMEASKKVANLLTKALKTSRVAVVAEGLGVNHLHVKLYPLHGLGSDFKPTESKETVYFRDYQGYISTQLGPISDQKELEKLAEEIRSFNTE